MKTVTCTLPNFSGNINGIDFVKNDDDSGHSALVEDDIALVLGSIPGYLVTDAPDPVITASADKPTAKK